MTKEDFANAFLEGMRSSEGNPDKTIRSLLGLVYDTRKEVGRLGVLISEMDDIARDNTIEVRCKSCSKDFVPDCELSEVVGSAYYCGGSEWCTP